MELLLKFDVEEVAKSLLSGKEVVFDTNKHTLKVFISSDDDVMYDIYKLGTSQESIENMEVDCLDGGSYETDEKLFDSPEHISEILQDIIHDNSEDKKYGIQSFVGKSFMDGDFFCKDGNDIEYVVFGDHQYYVTNNTNVVLLCVDLGNGHGSVFGRFFHDSKEVIQNFIKSLDEENSTLYAIFNKQVA
jgi:hypothetical protein